MSYVIRHRYLALVELAAELELPGHSPTKRQQARTRLRFVPGASPHWDMSH